MDRSTTIGIDLAEGVLQPHGDDAAGAALVKRKRRRGQVLASFERLDPCLVGIEACAGAHFQTRELTALGHEVRIMPPASVTPHVKRANARAGATRARRS